MKSPQLMLAPGSGDGLSRRSARAAVITMLGQGLQLILIVGAVMILARLLTPEDFGIVAMAMTVIAFTGVIRDLGLPSSTVFQSRLTHEQVSTLFWINTGFGILLGVTIIGVGPLVAWVYNEPRLVEVFWLMSTLMIFSGIGAQHEALLRRQMRFGSHAAASLVGTAAGVGASLALAAGGAGYWALAAHPPAEALARTAWLWAMTRWVPGRPRYGTGLWSMIWYAADVTAFRIVTHLGKHLDRILLSASAGPASVGLYSLADRWASMPGQMIYGQLGSVANSAFARLRDEPARFRDYYRQAMKLVWSVMLPLLAGIGLEAEAVLLVLAGDQWIEAIPLLRILAVAALALAVSHTTKWFYLAEGRTRAQLIWGTIAAVVTAAGVAAGVRWGVTGVAVGFCAATVLLVPASMGVWLRGSQIEAGDVGRAIWRPAAATLVMAGAWWLLPELDGRAILRLLWSVPLLAGVYCLAWRSLPGGGQAWLDCKRVARLLR